MNALIDCGAERSCISLELAETVGIDTIELESPMEILGADGQPIDQLIASARTRHVDWLFGSHTSRFSFLVLKGLETPAILGVDWLSHVGAIIDFKRKEVKFPGEATKGGKPKVRPQRFYTRVNAIKTSTSTSQAPRLPKSLSRFKRLFSSPGERSLPPHRPGLDVQIKIPKNHGLSRVLPYRLSPLQDDALKEFISKQLAAGQIRVSSSPICAPLFFVPKKDGKLRPCIDYRRLNAVTLPDAYPAASQLDLIEKAMEGRVFTKIDLSDAYNQLRVEKGHEWKTAFTCKLGMFECLTMPFGLKTAPAAFQRFINTLLKELMFSCVASYLDDVIIFSNSQKEHEEQRQRVLSIFDRENLHIKLSKCTFDAREVEFLGYYISHGQRRVAKERIEAVANCNAPRSVEELRRFLGFATFMHGFVEGFAETAGPLYDLLKKSKTWLWSPACQKAFVKLRKLATEAPVLHSPDSNREFRIETDASESAIGAILWQTDRTSGQLHPCAFFSRVLRGPEPRYSVADKELLAMVEALKRWRCYLEGSTACSTICTDSQSAARFLDKRPEEVSNHRHARWLELILRFNVKLVHVSATQNCRSDFLSRSLGPPGITVAQTSVRVAGMPESWETQVKEAQQIHRAKYPEAVDCNGILFVDERLLLPTLDLQLKAMQECHDSIASGHLGQKKTYERLQRDFYWPGMEASVRKFVKSCDACQRNKVGRHSPYGTLQSLPIPDGPFSSIGIDFITDLPPSKGCTCVATIVDRFSKLAVFLPLKGLPSARETAEAFLHGWYAYFGLPTSIVSDRGSQFTSAFWERLCELAGITRSLTTAYRPQGNGQCERVNQELDKYLRFFTNFQQDNWFDLLPSAQICYNSSQNESSKVSPFYALHACHPRTHFLTPNAPKTPAPEEFIGEIRMVQEELRSWLSQAQKQHAIHYNRHRKEAPTFEVGDKAMLNTRNIAMSRPSKKLSAPKAGPFTIIDKVGNRAYRLALPRSMQNIHPVFNVELLEAYVENEFDNRTQPKPPPVIVEGMEEWEVEKVVGSRRRGRGVEYLMQWKGYHPVDDLTWEKPGNLRNAKAVIDKFHDAHPNEPRAVAFTAKNFVTQISHRAI